MKKNKSYPLAFTLPVPVTQAHVEPCPTPQGKVEPTASRSRLSAKSLGHE